MQTLMDSIRHQGHIAESPQAGSHSWTQRSHLCLEGGDPFFDVPETSIEALTFPTYLSCVLVMLYL